MPKRCPPGVFCIENMTIVIILLLIGLVGLYFYKSSTSLLSYNRPSSSINIYEEELVNRRPNYDFISNIFTKPKNTYSTIPDDVLMNPYNPPLRDDRYILHDLDIRGSPTSGIRIPINIQTQSVDTTYRQVGILTRMNGREQILPLMGKPLFTNRDKWNFYTMNENNVKLPISNKKKSCTNEYGCDNLYNGDTVYVEGYDGPFKVTSYDNNVMRYLPFL